MREQTIVPHPNSAALQRANSIVGERFGEFAISKRALNQAGRVQLIREKREQGNQNLCFASRPFVLCGLPVRALPAGELIYERRNGHFVLQVPGHPKFGLPYGRMGSFPSSSLRLPFDKAVEWSASGVQPRCWTVLECRREASSIDA